MKTVEYTHNQNYNKMLVVGHAMSEQKAMMELLNTAGMSIAKPLKQHSIKATEISQILSQTYNPTGKSKEQLNVDKVWDGLALDLFMSNRDKKWWGWSDSKALPYLNYWKSIDSRFGFIFIYDTPENFIKQILLKSDSISEDTIVKAVDEWCEYNEALLKFYYRNMECSLLVNIQQVKLRTREYLQQVSKQIGLNHAEIDDNAIITLQETFQDDVSNPLFSYLVDNVLKEYSSMSNIFEELQSVANFPFNDLNKREHSALDALFTLQNDKEQYRKLQEKNSAIKKENEAFQRRLTHLKSKQKELVELEKSKSFENEELLTQLMSVQEELEKYYLSSQKSRRELASLEKILKEKQEENESLAKEFTYVRESKSQELKSIKKNIVKKTKEHENLKLKLDYFQKRQKELVELEKVKTSENEELLTQLMSVQEELEKYYLENKKLKEKQQDLKRYYGAAERIKKQLRYRVGQKVTENYKSIFGILSLPFSLLSVYIDYKKEKKKTVGKNLPPLKSYADAYEVPRIKKHHAYRVGDVLISSLQTPFGIFALPSKLFKLSREFKKERNNV